MCQKRTVLLRNSKEPGRAKVTTMPQMGAGALRPFLPLHMVAPPHFPALPAEKVPWQEHKITSQRSCCLPLVQPQSGPMASWGLCSGLPRVELTITYLAKLLEE